MIALSDALAWATAPEGMAADQAEAVLDLLLSGTLAPADGAAVLVAQSSRGERPEELAAWVRGLLRRATPVPSARPCLELCGTGGTGLERFNISTAAAVVAAACGVVVAKHGNRGSKQANGSFDLLEALQVPITLPPAALTRLLDEVGLAFLFARALHPAVAAAVPYRQAAGRRTIFNLAGPLANPAQPRHHVVGTASPAVQDVVARALAQLGHGNAVVVHGHPGLDEWSITGPTRVLRVTSAGVSERLDQAAVQPGVVYTDLPAGLAADNARTFADLLAGRHRGPLAEAVAVNAGAAIALWRGEEPAADGPAVASAREALQSGRAWTLFARYRSTATALVG